METEKEDAVVATVEVNSEKEAEVVAEGWMVDETWILREADNVKAEVEVTTAETDEVNTPVLSIIVETDEVNTPVLSIVAEMVGEGVGEATEEEETPPKANNEKL